MVKPIQLKRYEWAACDGNAPGDFACRMPGCARLVIRTDDGFHLPFCREHLEPLGRKTFYVLRLLAKLSPFDAERCVKAERAVGACIARLTRMPSKKQRGAAR